MIFGINHHTRDYNYRPPLRNEEGDGTDWPLYRRFIKTYLWPYRWQLLLCLTLITLNVNSTYVVTYLIRNVVDNVLVIRTTPPNPSLHRITTPDRDRQRAPSRPAEGLGRRIGLGKISMQRPPEAGRKLLLMALFYILTQVTFNVMGRLAARRQITITNLVKRDLWNDMHHKVMELTLSYHQSMNPGRLMSRIVSDAESAQVEMMALFTSSTSCITVMSIGFVIMLVAEWRLAAITLATVPIYWYLVKTKRPHVRQFNREIRHTNACMYGLVTQKMEAIKAIQSYGAEKRENLFFHRLAACLFRDSVNVQWYANMLGLQSEILAHLANCAILLYGGKLVLDGEMSMGKLLFVQVTSQNLFQPVLEFSNLSFILQRLRVALLRCASVLDQKPEIIDAPDSVPFPIPIRKSIEIKHLKFTYPTKDLNREATEKIANPTEDSPEEEEPTTTHTPVLRDINLTVPAGTWLCIMGASGSGKTTLLHLLARLYKPDSGEILLDGIPLDKISTSSLRRAMGVIPQEAQIFSGTIRDNIAYGKPDATNAEILEAAKAAQMHDVIMKMNIKYETIVGQRGSSLSGGQRQRLSLARALLSKPELLILDDCTSALDANTERKIQETLTEILNGRTAIMVSQRISMAMRCHQICVLENGVVSECGTHKELLANHGFYARLYAQQTGQPIDG